MTPFLDYTQLPGMAPPSRVGMPRKEAGAGREKAPRRYRYPLLRDEAWLRARVDEGLYDHHIAWWLGCPRTTVQAARRKFHIAGVAKGTYRRKWTMDERLTHRTLRPYFRKDVARRRLTYRSKIAGRKDIRPDESRVYVGVEAQRDLSAPFSETTWYNRWVRGPAPADEHVEWQKCYWLGMSITHMLHQEPEP